MTDLGSSVDKETGDPSPSSGQDELLTNHIEHLGVELHRYRHFYDQIEAVGLAHVLSQPLAGVAPFLTFAPPGHFYSPIPSMEEIESNADTIFDLERTSVPGVDLRATDQLATLEQLGQFANDFDPPAEQADGWRYWIDNPSFGIADATVLQATLRHRRPNRVIEIGSGWTSALMVDVNERHFGGSMELTFIEPYPDPLYELLSDADRDAVTLMADPIQAVDKATFESLEPGDVLFIDTSHVVRPGSDTTYIFFEVLPHLPPGVHVHIHDIFFPFELPRGWVEEGRLWSETYLLRALLTDNDRLRINFWGDYLARHHRDAALGALPQLAAMGGSCWLQTH